MSDLLKMAKDALDITGTYKDDEVSALIDAALYDLGIAGINIDLLTDPLVVRAVLTYCRVHFNVPDNNKTYELLKKSYDEQKAQLQMASGYTYWNGADC